MMDWIVLLVAGAFIGGVASMLVRSGRSFGIITSVVVGIAGALVARWLFGGILGVDAATTAGQLSWTGIGWGIVGSIAMLLILQVVGALFAEDEYRRHTTSFHH